MRKSMRWSCTAAVGLFMVTVAIAGTTTIVSVSTAGVQEDFNCELYLAISGDGRYVTFVSYADNLVPNDTNPFGDVFVRDTVAGTTTLVDVDSNGVQANGGAAAPYISADGRYVQYGSFASNLVAGDTNGVTDGFVFDRSTATTTRVTLGNGGVEGNAPSWLPVLSADARYVAFESDASNLGPGDSGSFTDAFVRDLSLGVTTRISVTPTGGEADGATSYPFISADGRYVVFMSDATNLVAGDTNGRSDVFRCDLATGAIERASVSSSGAQSLGSSFSWAWANISPDGRFVTFDNDGDDLTAGDANGAADCYVRDMLLGTTTLVSVPTAGGQGDGGAVNAATSADGRFVTFSSAATNMVANDSNGTTDIFVRDVVLGTTRCLSVDSSGNPGNGQSDWAMPTPDARHVAFFSYASNLVAGDNNGYADGFVFSDTWVLFRQFGTGLAGSGGYVPELEGADGPASGGFAIQIENVLGAAPGILFVGIASTDLYPVFGGHFYVDPTSFFLPVPLVVSGSSGFPGAGGFELSGVNLVGYAGLTIEFQFLANDPGAVHGVSMTNGLELTVSD